MNPPLAKNNAFGRGSPSWNLPFPSGNLTAAEVLAYFPHWIKSIDIINRFVTNGAKSHTIAAMINEFRYLPGGGDNLFRPNSVQIMMAYAMRRTGHSNWTVGNHSTFERLNPQLTELDLDVRTFRTPRETHPKSAAGGQDPDKLQINMEAEPVEFKNLALHVKRHPFGSDALDLARCVQYAVTYPDEIWYFPKDFEALVTRLGGPATITHSHLDRQIFDRRASFVFPSPSKSNPRFRNNTPRNKHTGSNTVMPQSRRLTGRASTPATGSPLKRMTNANGAVQIGRRRKSGRLANKASINLREYDSDATEEKDNSGSPYSGYSTPLTKRKFPCITATPGTLSNDSDFVADGSEPDDEIPEAEAVSDEELMSPAKAARSRAAARKARQSIRSMSTETQRNIESLGEHKLQLSFQSHMLTPATAPTIEVSPEMMSLARTFSISTPVFVQPPMLSANRLRVDSSTIFLYAAEGCTSLAEMWASALSSTRFNGPRRHPPFRELYRLINPPADDLSDWAENIRWAKEQYAVFGSDTWTEYDYHLEVITEHRRMNWVSEEAIRASYSYQGSR